MKVSIVLNFQFAIALNFLAQMIRLSDKGKNFLHLEDFLFTIPKSLLCRMLACLSVDPPSKAYVTSIYWECLAGGKFGKFSKLSVLCQTSISQILAYKWYPYG